MESPAVQVLPNVFDKDTLLGVKLESLPSLRQLTFKEFWDDVQLVQKGMSGTEEACFKVVARTHHYAALYGVLFNDAVIQSAKEAEQKLNPTSSRVAGNENKNDDDEEQEAYALLLIF